MVKNADRVPGDKGLSTRHLILVFLAGVAVCGVFFSLGFLVGYNERSARMAPVTERVATPATIPPTVNTPLETTPVGSSGTAPSINLCSAAARPNTSQRPCFTTRRAETCNGARHGVTCDGASPVARGGRRET